MSLRTIQRLAMASVLALGGITAVGCDDDNGDEDGDDGAPDGGDGGGDGDGVPDGTPDGADGADGDGGDGPVLCGVNEDVECAPTDTGWNDFVLDACCDTDDAKSCGAVVPELEGSPLIGCFAKAQPGNGSESCSDLFDQLDGVDDNGFTTTLSGAQVTFPGCCTPSGLCGVNVDSFSLGAGADLQVGFGCIPISKFDLAGDDADAGVPDGGAPVGDAGTPEDPILPYCVPEKATADMACPPNMQVFAGPNLCDVLPESGLPFIATEEMPCTGETQTPTWVCAARGWPLISTGEAPAAGDFGDCLEFLPDILHGCGIGETAEGCVPNAPETLFGCVDVEAEGLQPVLTQLIANTPDIACGCGAAVPGDGTCIPNTAATVCGGLDIEALPVDNAVRVGTLARVPDFACGCGEATPNGLCLRNTATSLCGTLDVESLPVDNAVRVGILARVPEFLCGCGPLTPNGLCLRNTGVLVCGALEVEVQGHPALTQVPNYLCGCGNGVVFNPTAPSPARSPCLSNVGLADAAGNLDLDTAICGAAAAPYNATNTLNSWCGCGVAETDITAICVPRTAETTCGNIALCATVGAAGAPCPENTVCADRNNDTIGDSCGAP